jgi:hypothetical protein
MPLGAVIGTTKNVAKGVAKETTPVPTRVWELAVGSRIAAKTSPSYMEKGTLFVRVANATWAQELALLSDDILRELRTRGIQVEALRFRTGPVEPPPRPPQRDEPRKAPPLAPIPKAVKTELAKVDDEVLRAIIERAASRSLGWEIAPPTSARPAARAPRSAASKNAPPDQTPKPSRAGRRGSS